MAEEKRQFPTEVIDLPSKGYFYPEDSPLSSGQVEIKYMTAKEEDILTSVNLIKKGLVIDMLLQSLIVDQNINYKDILIGDKNAIMVASRILGYGKEYIVDIDDDSGETESVTIDLTALKDKEIDFSKFERGKNEFSFTLPNSKRELTFKFLTSGDEDEVEKELKSLSKLKNPVDPEMTTRLKRRITSVDGNSDQSNINKFVDNEFLSVDSFAFREYVNSITPDVDMDYSYVSSIDGEVKEITVPVTVQFFWPDSRK
jgi:hypothetical protein